METIAVVPPAPKEKPSLPNVVVEGKWETISSSDDDHPLEKSVVKIIDGVQYCRKVHNRDQVYEVTGDSRAPIWTCYVCRGDVLGAEVAHTIRDGLFPLSGGGECHYEKVPYCPNCEVKPNYHGSPITP